MQGERTQLQKLLVVFIIITWSLAILVVLNTISLNSKPQNTALAALIIALAIAYYFMDCLGDAKRKLREKIALLRKPLQND